MFTLRKRIFIFVLLLGAIGFNIFAEKELKGEVAIIKKGDITIHSYMSPENSAMVTSQIIETKNKIIIIDTQFVRPYAKELAEYVKRINKPIDRIIISHGHPDHWFGLEFFKGKKIYALKETTEFIKKYGDIIVKAKQKNMGKLVTDKVTIPTNMIKEGKETIDGLTLFYKRVKDAEDGVQLMIAIPDIKVLVAQDLLYNEVHLFTGQNAFDGWINFLKKLEKKCIADTILVGHGKPADHKIFGNVIDYVKTAKEIYNTDKTGEKLKRQLMARYKTYKAAFMLDLSNSYLYKKTK